MKLLWQRLRHMLTPLAGADQAVNLAENTAIEVIPVSRVIRANGIAALATPEHTLQEVRVLVVRIHQPGIALRAVGHQSAWEA